MRRQKKSGITEYFVANYLCKKKMLDDCFKKWRRRKTKRNDSEKQCVRQRK